MSALHVVFIVGDTDLVVAASDVLHMESFTSATKVPGAPDHVAGLVQIRHRVVPVVDVRKRLGLPFKEPSLDSRVLVVKSGERAVGLLVDKAREVIQIDAGEFKEPPDVVTAQSAGFVRSVVQVAGRLLMLINLEKIIGEVRHGE